MGKDQLGAILSTGGSLHRPYLTYMAADKHIYFIYPRRSQGVALGNALTAAYLKARATIERPKVLICGSGKQIYYMLETFVMHRERLEVAGDNGREKQIHGEIRDDFLLMADTELFTKEGGHIQHIEAQLEPWPASKKVQSFIIRTGIKEALRKTKNFYASSLDLHILPMAPYELLNLELAWQAFGPFHIVVVSDEKVEKLLIVLSEICNVVGRSGRGGGATDDNGRFVTPLFIIDAESGKTTRLRNIGDGIVYYNLFTQKLVSVDNLPAEVLTGRYFPSQFGQFSGRHGVAFGDCLIDVFDDTKEQVMGLLNALDGNKSDTPALEMQLCECNRPGSLAELCAKLSGLVFGPSRCRTDRNVMLPSFACCRYIQQGNENCCFAGLANLSDNDIRHDPPVLMGLLSSGPGDGAKQKRAEKFLEPIVKRLDLRQLKVGAGTIPKLVSDANPCVCPGAINCPIADVQRHVDVRAEYGHDKKQLHYYVGGVDDTHLIKHMQKEVDDHHTRPLTPDTYARVTMCCRQASEFGTSAYALNALRLKELLDTPPTEFPHNMVNLTYLRDFDCFEDSFSNMTMYGNIDQIKEKEEFRARLHKLRSREKFAHPIKAVLIRPTAKGFQSWWDFAEELLNFLNLGSTIGIFKMYPMDDEQKKMFGTLLVMEECLYDKMIDHFEGKIKQGPEYKGRCFCDSGSCKPREVAYNDCPLSKELESLFLQKVLTK